VDLEQRPARHVCGSAINAEHMNEGPSHKVCEEKMDGPSQGVPHLNTDNKESFFLFSPRVGQDDKKTEEVQL